ncbi:MAG TPA: Spy/CpxP family protein refolding chaperone [Thermoanaerobaculia bacterium]|nr:Spy/CpxP family protein refolding chaperone [Thermoanaerobaculia bacterium]
MKSPKRFWYTLAIVAGLALPLAFLALAQAGPGGGHAGGGHGCPHGGCPMAGPCGGPHHMLRDLDLTEAQRTEIHALFEAQHEAHETQRTAVEAAKKALHDLVLSDSYTEEAARAQAQALANAMAEAISGHVGALHAIYELLTPEQRQELAANVAACPGMGGAPAGKGHHGHH